MEPFYGFFDYWVQVAQVDEDGVSGSASERQRHVKCHPCNRFPPSPARLSMRLSSSPAPAPTTGDPFICLAAPVKRRPPVVLDFWSLGQKESVCVCERRDVCMEMERKGDLVIILFMMMPN